MSENDNKQVEPSVSMYLLMGGAVAAAVVAMVIQSAMAPAAHGDEGGNRPAAAAAGPVATLVEGQRAQLKAVYGPRSRGAKSPQAELVVYGDFTSPFAATSGAAVDGLLKRFGDRLAVHYRHFARSDDHTSVAAAVAAEAAAKLGRFEAFRALVFGRNDGLGYVDFTAWAADLDLDDKAFRSAMASAEATAAVQNESASAKAMGLTQRPTFFLNGVKIPGTLPEASLGALVERELKSAAEAGGLKALMATPSFDLDGVDIGTMEVKKDGVARHGETRVRISDADPSWGSPDAKVTIVEFGDFLCPYCARGAKALTQLKAKYGEDKLRVVFKNLPLRMHRYADAAARAVLAAGRQGKFWEMHRKLYTRQSDVKSGGVDAILGLALELGLDLDTLMEDMSSVAIRQHVANDMAEAERMGVRFTPNYFINDEHIGGALPYNNFVQIIDKHMKR